MSNRLKIQKLIAKLEKHRAGEGHHGIIEQCDELGRLARQEGMTGVEAYAMRRKASELFVEVSLFDHEQQNYMLHRSWFGHALESIANKCEELDQQKERIYAEIEELLNGAVALARKSQSLEVLTRIVLKRGQLRLSFRLIESTRYIKRAFLVKWLVKYPTILHKMRYFTFEKAGRQRLKQLLAEGIADLKHAVKLAKKGGDDVSLSYVYYNCAVEYRLIHKYKALFYLWRAKKIATKKGDSSLVTEIDSLRSVISGSSSRRGPSPD